MEIAQNTIVTAADLIEQVLRKELRAAEAAVERIEHCYRRDGFNWTVKQEGYFRHLVSALKNCINHIPKRFRDVLIVNESSADMLINQYLRTMELCEQCRQHHLPNCSQPERNTSTEDCERPANLEQSFCKDLRAV